MISVLLFVNDVSAEYQPFVFALYNKKDAPYNAATLEPILGADCLEQGGIFIVPDLL